VSRRFNRATPDNYSAMSALCPSDTPLYACPKQDEKRDVPMDWLFILAMACIKRATGIEPLFGCWS
jgi:hypothetical protein